MDEQFPREDATQNKDNDLGLPLDNSVTNDEEQHITHYLDTGSAVEGGDNLDSEYEIDDESSYEEEDDSESDQSEDELE